MVWYLYMNNTTNKNHALHVIKSYLNILKIPFEDSSELIVKGNPDLKVILSSDTKSIAADAVSVGILDVISPDLNRITNAIHLITEKSGYGKPTLIDRGEEVNRKINYKDDFELIYLRHSLLRRTPNIQESDIDKYLYIIKRVSFKTINKFKNILIPMGFDVNDLINIGRLHTLCFLHNYAWNPEINNIKLLTEYLYQRFNELTKLTQKKALNSTCLPSITKELVEYDYDVSHCMPDMDLDYEDGIFTFIDTNNKKHLFRVKSDKNLGLDIYVDNIKLIPSEIETIKSQIAKGELKLLPCKDNPENINITQSQKIDARQELYSKLEQMNAESRNFLLAYAALSKDYAPEARSVAQQMCEELKCPKCNNRVYVGVHCSQCNTKAVLRYGIDVVEFRKSLEKQNSSLIPALIKPKENKVLVNVSPSLSKEEIDVLVKKLSKECFDALPETLFCPSCKQNKTKDNFGIRVPRDRKTGYPQRACRQSRCVACRRMS